VPFDVFENLATATATAADIDYLLGIARLENQPCFIGLGQDVQRLSVIDDPTDAPSFVVLGGISENQTGLFGLLAAVS
jgi:hypothetical protein